MPELNFICGAKRLVTLREQNSGKNGVLSVALGRERLGVGFLTFELYCCINDK